MSSPIMENKTLEELNYVDLKALRDSSRFYARELGRSVYLFDHHSGEIFTLQEELIPLYKAPGQKEFNAILDQMSVPDRKLNTAYLRGILDQEDRPVHQPHTRTKVANLKLNLDSSCNLNCKYCFKDPEAQKTRDMNMITKAIDYLLFESGKEADHQSIGLNLTSEPLTDPGILLEIHKYMTKAARKDWKRLHNIGFFFITNGTIGDKQALKAVKKTRNEPYIHVSIDGPREVHDALRVTHSGKGTYNQICENLKLFRKKGFRLKAESVLTRNFPHPREVVLHLMELGFEKINLKPVRRGTPCSFTPEDLEAWKEGYNQYFALLTSELLENRYWLFRCLNKDFALKYLPRILGRHKIKFRCFWGINNYSMDSKGDYYPCDALLGMEEFKVGDVTHGLNWEKFQADLDCEKRRECASCWARHLCGGTCYANSILRGKNLMEIDPLECAMNKFLIRSNLEMLFRLMEEGFDLDLLGDLLKS